MLYCWFIINHGSSPLTSSIVVYKWYVMLMNWFYEKITVNFVMHTRCLMKCLWMNYGALLDSSVVSTNDRAHIRNFGIKDGDQVYATRISIFYFFFPIKHIQDMPFFSCCNLGWQCICPCCYIIFAFFKIAVVGWLLNCLCKSVVSTLGCSIFTKIYLDFIAQTSDSF